MSIVAKRQINRSFYPLVKDELLWMRSQKLINNAAFVYFALRLENPHGDRPVQLKTKEFAFAWGIPESSLYEALAKLRDINALTFLSKTLSIQWQQDFDIWQLNNLEVNNSQQAPVYENPELPPEVQRKLRRPRKKLVMSEKQSLQPLSRKSFETPHTFQTSPDSEESGEVDIDIPPEETEPPLGGAPSLGEIPEGEMPEEEATQESSSPPSVPPEPLANLINLGVHPLPADTAENDFYSEELAKASVIEEICALESLYKVVMPESDRTDIATNLTLEQLTLLCKMFKGLIKNAPFVQATKRFKTALGVARRANRKAVAEQASVESSVNIPVAATEVLIGNTYVAVEGRFVGG